MTKTGKILFDTMPVLLRTRNFGKITVRDICEEALISRATFYAHFTDKYELLRHWLVHFRPDYISEPGTYEQVEKAVNEFIYGNESIIKNLVYAADHETLKILQDAILSAIKLSSEENNDGNPGPKYHVLSNFCVGGLIHYLLWQIRYKFPPDVPPMNLYLFGVIEKLRKWDLE